MPTIARWGARRYAESNDLSAVPAILGRSVRPAVPRGPMVPGMVQADPEQARFTPSPWLNRLMTILLTAPGIQRIMGGTALLTVTGRRSGRTYTTPVSYARDADRVIVTSHRSRVWWRNLADRPRVRIRLAGTPRAGTARLVPSDAPEASDLLDTYLAQQRMAARAYGATPDHDGRFDADAVAQILAESVVIEITLDRRPVA